MSPVLQQRCWNHAEREASCRCPRCMRSFCRECVTEHETLLLCSTCLQSATSRARPRRRLLRRFLPAAMAFVGLVLAWSFYFGIGQIFLESLSRPEQTWPDQ